MDNQTKARLSEIKRVIKKGDYEKALEMLKPINHPIAGKWEISLNRRIAERQVESSRRMMYVVGGTVIVATIIGILFVAVLVFSNLQIVQQPLIVDETGSEPVPVIIVTPTPDLKPWEMYPTATYYELEQYESECRNRHGYGTSQAHRDRIERCIEIMHFPNGTRPRTD